MNDPNKVHDEPSGVEEQSGSVHVDGPDGIDIMLTPKAALETAKRLGDTAVDILMNESQPPKTAPE